MQSLSAPSEYRPGRAERLRFLIGLPLSLLYFPLMLLTVCAYLLMPRALVARLQAHDRRNEIAARLTAMAPYIAAGERVLDFGAGRGDFLKIVSRELKVDIVGIDIIDYTDDGVDVLMFDGKSIPLPDKSVDVGMAAFVLHHTKNHKLVIDELNRVSRKRIVIFEDTYFTPWQKLFIIWNDFYANIIMGFIRALKLSGKFSIVSMPMPFTFRSVRGWQRFFAEQSLTVNGILVRHARVKPMSKVTFVLDARKA
jgi:SAM-dependent methyltransferase